MGSTRKLDALVEPRSRRGISSQLSPSCRSQDLHQQPAPGPRSAQWRCSAPGCRLHQRGRDSGLDNNQVPIQANELTSQTLGLIVKGRGSHMPYE